MQNKPLVGGGWGVGKIASFMAAANEVIQDSKQS
jgi:hypothetical protein